jgi:MFS family permease
VRIVAGKISDRYGRVSVLRVSSFLLTVAMIVIGLATTSFAFYAGAVLFGLSTGMSSPTVSAWTVDLSHSEHRGRAMATMYIALEAGIGLGALLSGWIYNNNPAMFSYAFWSAGFFSFLAFIYLIAVVRQRVPQVV